MLTVIFDIKRITTLDILLWNLKSLHATLFLGRFFKSQSKMARFSGIFFFFSQNPFAAGLF